MARPSGSSSAHDLQCMEVWGGNRAVNNGVVMMGLDAWVYCHPCGDEEAGGDVHYVSSCASGRVVRLMVADVAGHGGAVAELAGRLRGLMGAYVNYAEQGQLVGELNREFARLAQLGRFATAVAATYWTPTDELVVTSAGHPPPLRYVAARRAWETALPVIDRSPGRANIPLGIEDRVAYDEIRLRLRRDDLVLFYTDGLIERRAPDGRMLGAAGLAALLAELDTTRPQELMSALVQRVEAFGGAAPLEDDLTLLLIRRNLNKPRVSMLAGAATTLRLLREMPRSVLRGTRCPWPEFTWRNIAGAFIAKANGDEEG